MTLSYDADGNLSGYSDGTTSATYTYDDVGRKLSETLNYGQFTKSFSFSYYGNGLKQTFTAPDSTVYTYHYGLNNELREVQIPGVGSITIPAYTWNRPATVNFPGGTQRTDAYNALMRLESLTVLDPSSNSLLDYAYTHDEVGNILTKTTEHGLYDYDYDYDQAPPSVLIIITTCLDGDCGKMLEVSEPTSFIRNLNALQ